MNSSIKWGPDGLIPAIAQDVRTGEVLMQAYINQEALDLTLSTGTTWYWSRSRRELWNKGATSGHTQRVLDLRIDCDGDSLLLLVEQTGPACHTGASSCFFTRVPGLPRDHRVPSGTADSTPDSSSATPGADAAIPERGPEIGLLLSEVYDVVADRKKNPAPGSYTNKLLAGGPDMYCKKIGEEATEVVLAVKNGDADNLAFEAADLLFHTLVALVDAGVPLDAVAGQLESRRGKRRLEAEAKQ